MGTWISNQTGENLEIEGCRVLDTKSGEDLSEETKTLPPGERYLLKSSSLDVCQELQLRVGWREYRFSIGGGKPLRLPLSEFKNIYGKNFRHILFRIGSGGVLTYTTLERTKCKVSNKTDKKLLIKNHFVYDATRGAGVDGNFNSELLPGQSRSLKFCEDIDWNARWRQLEFHFSIDGQEPIKLPLIRFEGIKEYVFQNGAGVLEVKPKDGHSCIPWR